MHSTKLKSIVQDFWQVSVVLICFCAYVTIWGAIQRPEPPADDLVIEGDFTAHGPVLWDQHERKINVKDNETGN